LAAITTLNAAQLTAITTLNAAQLTAITTLNAAQLPHRTFAVFPRSPRAHRFSSPTLAQVSKSFVPFAATHENHFHFLAFTNAPR
jgi:hypothetical protein